MIDRSSYILSKLDGEFNAAGKLHTYCPFHEDLTKSFSVTEEGLFICGSTSCGIRGNFHHFYKRMEGLSWPEVFEKLEGKQVTPHLRKLLEKEDRTKKFTINEFPQSPFVEPINSVQYLHERGLDSTLWDQFGLVYGSYGTFSGISIDNTLVCPVFDIDGTYRTFQVRYLSSVHTKRWLNPQESPNQDLLYGGWLVRDLTKYLWIVEGASDVWNLYKQGIQSVGLFTKEATNSQLNKIYELCCEHGLLPVICLDGDVPEKDISILTSEMLAYNLSPKVVHLQPDEDPGSLGLDRLSELKNGIGDVT